MSDGWTQNLAYELHRPIQKILKKRHVVSNRINEIWASDLIEMGKFSKWNKGIKYLLMVIDVFSKFGWIEPLKDNRGQSVAKAFQKIFKSGRKLRFLWTDGGSKFYNKHVKQMLSKENKIIFN